MATMRSLLSVTLATCFALILAGAIVRASGSGLGCPDWPRCFGKWVPPLQVSELPTNYQEVFAIKGKTIAPFSAAKTWTEYLNRLLGMVVGLQVFALMLLGFKRERSIARLSVGLFLLVGLQGLLGSLVVSSHLASNLVTLHMLLAMVVLFILLELCLKVRHLVGCSPHRSFRQSYGWLLIAALVQLALGTQSREQIDRYLHETHPLARAEWYDSLTGIFTAHRLWAYLLAFVLIWHLYRHHKLLLENPHLRWVSALSALVLILQMLSGIAFKHLDFPSLESALAPLARKFSDLAVFLWLAALWGKEVTG